MNDSRIYAAEIMVSETTDHQFPYGVMFRSDHACDDVPSRGIRPIMDFLKNQVAPYARENGFEIICGAVIVYIQTEYEANLVYLRFA